ncbi:MAG TPA: hypothetical protein VFU88_22325 [Ktedonobacterales bacterium]|jgi:hypothetical protein|nr:hypothetical protein [Ktedonobacterales bacterium]
MGVRLYEAILSRPESIARIRAAQRDIERLGGRVSFAPPAPGGLILVTLALPETLTPAQVLPGIPFAPA